MEPLAHRFVEHRLDDGGWSCDRIDGARRSSFHSTLNSLAGLLAHESVTGGTRATREARRAGEEYLLSRRLLYRRSTGERVRSWVDRFAHPFRRRHDVLRATDHFRRAATLDGRRPDPRSAEAVAVVRAAQGPDGRWVQGERDPGAVWFEVDVPAGEPSRWLTLYALRVLAWWESDVESPR